MTLSPYHKKYASQPDAEVQNRVNEKRQELAAIFAEVQLKTTSEPVRIAVVGCGDKRYVQWHKDIFETLLKRPVEITTFDIVVDHLQGEENVIQHDCTVPFPGRPFDITYTHVLLRFIETEKQWDLILNSFHTLTLGGLAIHLLDTEDYKTEASLLPNGLFTVPLKRWEEKLDELGIEYKEIPVKYGLALVLNK